MGIGKTIQIISLILTSSSKETTNLEDKKSPKGITVTSVDSESDEDFEITISGSTTPDQDLSTRLSPGIEIVNETKSTSPVKDPKPTLIVCPLSTVSNWEEQIRQHVHPNSNLKVYIYHGSGRSQRAEHLSKYVSIECMFFFLFFSISWILAQTSESSNFFFLFWLGYSYYYVQPDGCRIFKNG